MTPNVLENRLKLNTSVKMIADTQLTAQNQSQPPDLDKAIVTLQGITSEDEDLDFATELLNQQNIIKNLTNSEPYLEPTLQDRDADKDLSVDISHPQQNDMVVEDFIRNYLVSKKMSMTFHAFENEWYDMHVNLKPSNGPHSIVPNAYIQIQELEQLLAHQTSQLNIANETISKVRAKLMSVNKCCDYYKLQTTRLSNELKNISLLSKSASSAPQPDHQDSPLNNTETRPSNIIVNRKSSPVSESKGTPTPPQLDTKLPTLPTAQPKPKPPIKPKLKSIKKPTSLHKQHRDPSPPPVSGLLAEFNVQPAPQNPAHVHQPIQIHAVREIHSINAHDLAISAMAFHPQKLILASVADDRVLKLWSVPTGELLMTCNGHADWIADVAFHPRGSHIATASGDRSIKIWDLAQATASYTFRDHTQPVWSCSFHQGGDFLVSGSLDHTVKVWDLIAGKCRQTFRGHSDSVNAVLWQPGTNIFYSASGDKSICAWDARTGGTVHCIPGHKFAVNALAFPPAHSANPYILATSDAGGTVNVWDLRHKPTSLHSFELGSSNNLDMDASGSILCIASNNGTVHLLDISTNAEPCRAELVGHASTVQCCIFDHSQGEYLASGDSNGFINLWH